MSIRRTQKLASGELIDITQHRTGEGTLYLHAVKDVFSNKSSNTLAALRCDLVASHVGWL